MDAVNTKKKILWMSDSTFLPTGFATISTNIIYRLKDKYDCNYLGHNFIGSFPPRTLPNGWFPKMPFNVIGCGKEPYCRDILGPLTKKMRPDIFGVLLDTFMLQQSGFLQQDLAPAKTVMYYPSDGGGGLPQTCENILRKFHHTVAMSKHGQKQVKDYYNIKSDYIPHACDTSLYKPANKEEIKKKWGLQGKFVVGTVARNQGRKMLDRTIKAFALFCQDKPDAILFMHTDPVDNAAVFDLRTLISRYSLQNRVIFTGMNFYDGFPLDNMPDVYNAMDVFLLTTSGEGFGVPIIEAMACGVPVVATDYTTTPELVLQDGKAGEGVNIVGTEEVDMFDTDSHKYDILKSNGTITGSWTVERGMMDIHDCADKLSRIYADEKLQKLYSRNGRAKAVKYYEWEAVMPKWEKLLQKMTQD